MIGPLALLLIFCMGALSGWIMEVIYRFFFSAKKIVNPGFLNGPYLPLYGSGVLVLYLLSLVPVVWPLKILLFAVAMTLLELVTGIIFINHLKIKLWDYSREWMNFKGLICPRFSLYWTFLGMAFYILIFPMITGIVEFFEQHLALFFGVGIFYGLFGADVFNSLSLAYKIRAAVNEFNEGEVKKFWVDYREFKEKVRSGLKETRTTNFLERYFLSFNNLSHKDLKSSLNQWMEKRSGRFQHERERLKAKGRELREKLEPRWN